MRTLTLVSAAALVGVASVSLGDDDRAQKYMARYLQGKYGTNVVAIIQQKSEDKGTGTVKIQRSKDGKIRQTVLSPLHIQCEVLEDGKTLRTYLPDRRQMLIQPSNSIAQEASFRIPLVQKNYMLKSETGQKVANRKCVTVTATSRFNQVPTVRYQFDESTGFPLAMETILPGGEIVNSFEVVDIKFPKDFDESVFKMEPVGGVEVITYAEQKGLAKLSDATSKLGFSPVVPSKIPFGFQIQRISVSSENSVRSLCLKMTDGIQRATVYEWTYVPGEKIMAGEAMSYQICKGLRITIMTDLGSDLREAFLRPFLARNERETPAILTSVGF